MYVMRWYTLLRQHKSFSQEFDENKPVHHRTFNRLGCHLPQVDHAAENVVVLERHRQRHLARFVAESLVLATYRTYGYTNTGEAAAAYSRAF